MYAGVEAVGGGVGHTWLPHIKHHILRSSPKMPHIADEMTVYNGSPMSEAKRLKLYRLLTSISFVPLLIKDPSYAPAFNKPIPSDILAFFPPRPGFYFSPVLCSFAGDAVAAIATALAWRP